MEAKHVGLPIDLDSVYLFIIIITHLLLLLESMAAPRTVWKFGTLIKDSPLFIFTKFHVSNWSTLAPRVTVSVPLDSLDQAEFNTPYDVNFRL